MFFPLLLHTLKYYILKKNKKWTQRVLYVLKANDVHHTRVYHIINFIFFFSYNIAAECSNVPSRGYPMSRLGNVLIYFCFFFSYRFILFFVIFQKEKPPTIPRSQYKPTWDKYLMYVRRWQRWLALSSYSVCLCKHDFCFVCFVFFFCFDRRKLLEGGQGRLYWSSWINISGVYICVGGQKPETCTKQKASHKTSKWAKFVVSWIYRAQRLAPFLLLRTAFSLSPRCKNKFGFFCLCVCMLVTPLWRVDVHLKKYVGKWRRAQWRAIRQSPIM